MYTIAETPTFATDADDLWSEEERNAFFAWLAARKWSRLNGGLFLSCFMGFIIAWFAGGALSIVFSPESHTDAAMAAMTTGLWFSLAGATAGGYLGKLHGRWNQRRER